MTLHDLNVVDLCNRLLINLAIHHQYDGKV